MHEGKDKMAYTKNHNPWAAGNAVTISVMDNFETIYTEASSYLAAHNHDALYPTQTEMEATFWYSGNDGSGSGADADLIYKSGGNLHASSFAGLGVPTGLIILWYGSVGSIPSGWHICDGSGGTRDLRDKFVVGAGGTYSVGDSGGSVAFTMAGTVTVAGHVLTTAEMASHVHPYSERGCNIDGSYYTGSGGVTVCGTASVTQTSSSTGGGGAHGHSAAEGTSFTGNAVTCMPYYYALVYIQKV